MVENSIKKDHSKERRLVKKCLTENLKERLKDEDLRPDLCVFLIMLFK